MVSVLTQTVIGCRFEPCPIHFFSPKVTLVVSKEYLLFIQSKQLRNLIFGLNDCRQLADAHTDVPTDGAQMC